MHLDSKSHEYFMQKCLDLALRGKGKTSPNPLVGCIIVKNSKIIAEGWHDHYGGDHAEAMALKNARTDVKGADLYCNLEPCCHTLKKTPACLPLILDAGIKRVIISNIDPNPEVSGRSVSQMRNRGIHVFTGVLKEKDKYLNRFFYKSMSEDLPFVTIKIAQTFNGFISRRFNQQTWISGEKAVKYVHNLRSEFDAVLIGAKTVIADNPKLTVRLTKGRNPVRVILDSDLISYPDAEIYRDESAETWLFYNEKKNLDRYSQKHIRFFPMKVQKEVPELKSILKTLKKNNISSVLVEGGQNIFSQFINKILFDELIIIESGKYFNSGVPSVNLNSTIQLNFMDLKPLGDDLALIYGR